MDDHQDKPKDRASQPPARWVRPAALAAILAVAAFLRLSHFDLIEFKSDEALVCDLVIEMLESGRPAAHGLTSGPGLTNFPMFAYLLAVPMAISREPLFLTALIAAANLVAIGLLFHFAAGRWGLSVAWWSALLMATSPWAVLYSRKLWAQNLLPILIVPALFGLLPLLDGDRKRIWAVALCAGTAAMVHLSGMCALIVVTICLALFRPAVAWKRLGLAVLILLVPAWPYLAYQVRHGAEDRALLGRYLAGEVVRPEQRPRLAEIVSLSLDIVNDYGFERMVGRPETGPQPAFGRHRLGSVLGRWTLVVALAAALAHAGRGLRGRWRRRRRPGRQAGRSPRDYAVLILWLIVPLALHRASGTLVWRHYFIITLPVPFVLMGLLLEDLRGLAGRARPDWARALLQGVPLALGLALAASGTSSMVAVLRSLEQNGGAPGDYGVAYKHKLAALEYVAAQAGRRPAALVGDTKARTPLPGAEEYDYLLRLVRRPSGRKESLGTGPPRHFVIIDLYRYNLSAAERALVNTLAPKRFGPLLVCALPAAQASDPTEANLSAETTEP